MLTDHSLIHPHKNFLPPTEPIYDNQKDAGYDRLKEPGTSTTTMSDTQAGAGAPEDGVVDPASKDGAVPDPPTSGMKAGDFGLENLVKLDSLVWSPFQSPQGKKIRH